MAGVLALFGTTELSALEWVFGSLAGGAVYVGMLLVTREIDVAELRRVWARLAAVAARPAA